MFTFIKNAINRHMINKNIICLGLGYMLSMSMCFAQTKDSLAYLGIGIPQTKVKSTASIYTISGEELQKTAALNLQDALYGKLLGLTVMKNGGFSGDGVYGGSFNIRGTQTTTENNVLILVDGLERYIDRMSVDEVESVTVLKDAAAVALYGYRGINGAILVTTKRPTAKALTVSARYDHKMQYKPSSTEFVDAYGYAQALNEARSLDGLSPAYNQYELDAFQNGTYPSVYPNVDWNKEALKNTASENQATLNISGGSDNVKYLTLFNYVDANGLLNNARSNDGYSTQLKYSKANIRTNLDIKLTNTTKFYVNLMGCFNESNRPQGLSANDIMSYFNNTPAAAYPVLMSDGKTWGGTPASGANNIIARIQATGHSKIHERSLFADGKLVQDLAKITEGLSASLRVGYDNRTQNAEDWKSPFQYGSTRYQFDANGQVVDSTQFIGGSKSNFLEYSYWINDQWRSSNVQLSLDYSNQFNKHSIAGSLLYTTNNTVFTGQYHTYNRANVSFAGHYDYDSRYLADLVLMYSGSNRSWPEKFAFSPTLSLGWVLSNESFLKDNETIDLLKIRASAGILHSDYVPQVGLSLESYGSSAGWFTFGEGYGEQWGNFLSYFPTKHFDLERAKKLNIGMDARLWNSLDLTLEGYYQRRDNILQSAGELNSMVVGIPSSYINKGIVDSKGLEVAANFQKTFGDFTVNAGAMFTYGTNEIVDMVEAPKAFPYLSRIGQRVNQPYGLQAIGFFEDEADIANSPTQEFDRVKPGDVKYKDQNGDKVINENDEVPMGYAGTPEINYAFNFGLEYKGLGFDILFQGVDHYTVYLNNQGVFNPLVNNSNLSTYYNENCWHPGADNSNAIYPRLTSLASPNNYRSSSLWYKDASFMKLRHCEVYYKLPHSLLNKVKIEDFKIYVKGENLLSIDDLPANIDPENAWGGYPSLPAVAIGASIVF
jgi:TonB-linked SusC/RagA family outer membrane protein